jgi:hypothetical protein
MRIPECMHMRCRRSEGGSILWVGGDGGILQKSSCPDIETLKLIEAALITEKGGGWRGEASGKREMLKEKGEGLKELLSKGRMGRQEGGKRRGWRAGGRSMI